jgi:tetratricopeptide (TPR) repeat protein
MNTTHLSHRTSLVAFTLGVLLVTAYVSQPAYALGFKKNQPALAPVELQMAQQFQNDYPFYPDWASESSESETERLTREITASKNSNANLYLDRAYARLNTTDKAGALADYSKAIELDPKLVDAYYYRAELYKEMGNTPAAIQDYSKVIVLDPAYSSVYLYRAELYEKTGDYTKAIQDYSTDIAQYEAEGYGDTYLKRGQLYEKTGNPQAALADYNKTLSLDKAYSHAYYLRGNLFHKQGDTTKAMSDYSKLLKLEPENDAALTQRGLLYYTKGDFKKSLKDLNRAVAANSSNANAFTLLSLIKGLHLNDQEGSMEAIKQAQALFKEQGKTERYTKAVEAEALIQQGVSTDNM